MLRTLVLSVAQRRWVRKTVTGGIGRRVAMRFVAGDELDDALVATRRVNERGGSSSLDYLGEHCTDASVAQAATDTYRSMLLRLAQAGLDGNVSVKLTQLGLDIDRNLALSNAALIAATAAEAGRSLTLDMEDHEYTDRTLELCLRLADRYPGRVGVAVQAYLHRSPADLEHLASAKVQVRLCKGAYREPAEIAFQSRREVDAAFERLTRRLMHSEAYPMIATHDERLIRQASKEVVAAGRAPGSWEVQMLYGVRRELQGRLVEEGLRLRVYIPFGREWYPYLVRRIAERPANIRFFVEALLRG